MSFIVYIQNILLFLIGSNPPATQLILHNQPIWKSNNQLIWWYIAPLYNNNFVARQWHSSLAVYA